MTATGPYIASDMLNPGHPFGLLFHHFCDDCHARGQGAVSADEFVRLIDHAGRDRLIGAHDWVDRAKAGTLSERDICVSFDDGLLCQYDIALPVLKEYGLTAFWFTYSSPLKGETDRLEMYRYFRTVTFAAADDFYAAFFDFIDEDELADQVATGLEGVDIAAHLPHAPFYSYEDRRFRYVRDRILGPDAYNAAMDQMMARHAFNLSAAERLWMQEHHLVDLDRSGHIVGLHSHSHPTAMSLLAKDDQMQEYRRNKDILEAALGHPVTTMSHPCNSYNADTLDVLQGLDITMGFRADMPGPAASPFEYPRLNHARLMPEIGS